MFLNASTCNYCLAIFITCSIRTNFEKKKRKQCPLFSLSKLITNLIHLPLKKRRKERRFSFKKLFLNSSAYIPHGYDSCVIFRSLVLAFYLRYAKHGLRVNYFETASTEEVETCVYYIRFRWKGWTILFMIFQQGFHLYIYTGCGRNTSTYIPLRIIPHIMVRH